MKDQILFIEIFISLSALATNKSTNSSTGGTLKKYHLYHDGL